MPIIANAKKALRQSKTRNTRNRVVRATVRVAAKKTVQAANQSTLSMLFSAVDKAVKKNIIHKNKAARMKSRAAKRITAEAPAKVAKPKAAAKKKAVKKPAKKK